MPDRPLPDAMPSSFDDNSEYQETALQKVTRKLKAEPLIPLGALLTVAAFVNAWRATRRGDHNQAQRMFRARVLAQGFTVVAIVAGGFYYGQERKQERELWKVQQQQRDEEKRTKWIRELEARDAEEKALQERVARRRERKARGAGAAADAAAGAEGGSGEEAKPAGSVLGALGGWFGGGSKKSDGDKATTPEPAAVAAATTAAATPSAAAPPAAGADGKKATSSKGTSSLGTLGELFSKKGGAPSDKGGEEKK